MWVPGVCIARRRLPDASAGARRSDGGALRAELGALGRRRRARLGAARARSGQPRRRDGDDAAATSAGRVGRRHGRVPRAVAGAGGPAGSPRAADFAPLAPDACISALPLADASGYDAVIEAPRPKVLHDSLPASPPHFCTPLVLFSIAIASQQVPVPPCVALAVFREPVSQRRFLAAAKAAGRTPPPTLMSGDLSHILEVSQPLLVAWRAQHRAALEAAAVPKDWVLLFSRSNNFGRRVSVVRNDTVSVRHVNGTVEHHPVASVVFASTSVVGMEGDAAVFALLATRGVPRGRLVTCTGIEQLWALISLAPAVYTDRYHAGVASHRLGVPVRVLVHLAERTKMKGLQEILVHPTETVRKWNAEALDALKGFLEALPRPGLGRRAPPPCPGRPEGLPSGFMP